MTRHDLLEMEQRLRASLFKVLPFAAHAIYFPQNNEPQEPVWLPEESRLLLPLRQNDTLLGVFMARELNAERVEALLPDLPALASLCLDNLELYKAGRLDTDTGLATRQVLMDRMRDEVERIVAPFAASSGSEADSTEDESRENDGGFALSVIRFPGLENLARQWGYGFAQRFLQRLAETLRQNLPDGVLAARAEDAGFGLVFSGYDRTRCAEVLAAILHALEGISLPEPFTRRPVFARACAGFVLYPQDMDGEFADLGDPAPALLHKAGLALEVACARPATEMSRLMAYGQILSEGGVIRRTLPLSRMEISLGRGVGAREGQCFSVWSVDYPVQGGQATDGPLQPLYKGEIVVLESRAGESVAEILHLGDPSWPMCPGDTLVLLPRNAPSSTMSADEGDAGANDPQLDALTGLYRHGGFLAKLARAREGLPDFGLAMLHLSTPQGEDPHRMAQVARQCRETFSDNGFGDAVLGGRFATSTLVFFHPEADAKRLTETYSELCARLSKTFGSCGAGIALWPFLGYHPADMLEGCRKALEYALLLPAPHVGVLDSLALNISADKLHCRGDIFAAVEEYKEALLADAGNALAWNSLGVCMAGLGRHEEARTHFDEALRRAPDDAAIAYNLGAACQRLADFTAAAAHYEACLALAPDHLYALIRLGQLAERSNDLETARTRYRAAAEQDPASALPHRHLARIALRSGTPHAAREALHLALQRDPRDAESLTLLAHLYLDGGEDPELAETLARQSVALRPDSKNAWRTLARALEARGLSKQAAGALAKAKEM